jgi:hypothetical protein
MTRITLQSGQIVLRDGAIGTEEACCCIRCETCFQGSNFLFTPSDCAAQSPALVPDCPRDLSVTGLVAGSGATGEFNAVPAASACDCKALRGEILSATVTNSGSGYAILGRVAPTVTASVAGGSGAVLEVIGGFDATLTPPYWQVSAVSVIDGGTGYSEFAAVTFSVASGDTEVDAAYAEVSVDGGGAITFVAVYDAGNYYREDATLPGIALPTVTTLSAPGPCFGVGAEFAAVIDTDPASPTFGEVTAINVVDGGFNYYEATLACGEVTAYVSLGNQQFSFPVGIPDFTDQLSDPACGSVPPKDQCNAETLGERHSIHVFGPVGFLSPYVPFTCKCNSLFMYLALGTDCFECTLVNGIYDYRSIARGPYSYLCYKFELDESGCPVGDGQLVARRDINVGNEFGPEIVPEEGCGDCWDIVDLVPTVSFMPP